MVLYGLHEIWIGVYLIEKRTNVVWDNLDVLLLALHCINAVGALSPK